MSAWNIATSVWGTGGREFKSPRSDQYFNGLRSFASPSLYKIGGRLYKLGPFIVRGSCRVGGLPLQNCRGREPSLVHLLGVVLDHVARLSGDRRRLGVGTSGLEQETTADLRRP